MHFPHPGEAESIQVISDITNPWQRMGFVYLDAYTGEILRVGTSDEFSFRTWLTLLFYPIHVGSIFGLPTKTLAVLACLAITATSVTGAWMWWRRRPAGKLGSPRPPPPASAPGRMVAVTIALAVLLPTVGLTLLLVWLLGLLPPLFGRKRNATG